MAKDNEVRCVYCGAIITETQSNNPQDYLHPEYEKYTDENPKYCCSYCNGLTSINRALYHFQQSTTSIAITAWAWVNAFVLLIDTLRTYIRLYALQAVLTYSSDKVTVGPKIGFPIPLLQKRVSIQLSYST